MTRSRTEICMDILRASTKPIRITHMMYGTNACCNLLKELLPPLENKGLIHKSGIAPGYLYQTTEEGKKLIKSYVIVEEALGLSNPNAFYKRNWKPTI